LANAISTISTGAKWTTRAKNMGSEESYSNIILKKILPKCGLYCMKDSLNLVNSLAMEEKLKIWEKAFKLSRADLKMDTFKETEEGIRPTNYLRNLI